MAQHMKSKKHLGKLKITNTSESTDMDSNTNDALSEEHDNIQDINIRENNNSTNNTIIEFCEKNCLFCNNLSVNMENNLIHM